MRRRHGMAAIQTVMLVALSAIMMIGLSSYFGSERGISGQASQAVNRLFAEATGAGDLPTGIAADGGIEIVPHGSGAGSASTSGSSSSRVNSTAQQNRLNDLVRQYKQVASSCENVRGSNVGHSCVLQHQMLELARQTRDKAYAEPDEDLGWITHVLDYSLPNVTDLGDNAGPWWARWGLSVPDLGLQIADAAVTPVDFLLKLRESAGISDAWKEALNNSLFNWGDTGALGPGAKHFVNDLYPGFIDGARNQLDRAIQAGASDSELKSVIASINRQHTWLLEEAVPGGFDTVRDSGNTGSVSAWGAKKAVPPGAKLLRQLMWGGVLSERGLNHLNPNGSPAEQAAAINRSLWKLHEKGHVPRPRFARDHDFERWLMHNPNGSNTTPGNRHTVEMLLRLID
ncbi:MAG: hypothetical protein AAF266_09535 [Planctomycetota bacterium]